MPALRFFCIIGWLFKSTNFIFDQMLSYRVEENLELRPVSKRYAEELFSVVRKNFEHLNEWLPWAKEDYSIESAKEFIKMNRQRYAEYEISDYFIFENQKIIGLIGFNHPDFQNKSIEIGYWLDKDQTGKGIISKCCRVLIDYVFNELGLNRIVIRCATENKKSRAIPEKLGFMREGTARQDEWLHDRFVDLEIYSMLKEEWKDI